MADIKFYNLPFHKCSCRDKIGRPTLIARRYRQYYDLLKEKKSGIQALDEMGIKRMCCRKSYLVLPVQPMIDRNTDRFYDDTRRDVIRADTRELKPGINPPDFPLLNN